jgi:hypothetical protein
MSKVKVVLAILAFALGANAFADQGNTQSYSQQYEPDYVSSSNP